MRFTARKSSPWSEGTTLDRVARATVQYAQGRIVVLVDPVSKGAAWLTCDAASMTVEQMALMIRVGRGALTLVLADETITELTSGETENARSTSIDAHLAREPGLHTGDWLGQGAARIGCLRDTLAGRATLGSLELLGVALLKREVRLEADGGGATSAALSLAHRAGRRPIIVMGALAAEEPDVEAGEGLASLLSGRAFAVVTVDDLRPRDPAAFRPVVSRYDDLGGRIW